MNSKNPFVSLNGFSSENEREHFLCQAFFYADYLLQEAKRNYKAAKSFPSSVQPTEGLLLCRRAFHKYGLRCRVLEVVAHQMEEIKLLTGEGFTLIWGIAIILRHLVHPDPSKSQPLLKRGFDWLSRKGHSFPRRMQVIHAAQWRSISPEDGLGWKKLIDHCPSLQWDTTVTILGENSLGDPNASEKSDPPDIELGDSQKKALIRLRNFHFLKLRDQKFGGIDPRPIPLLVGPSGCGKTALVRHFAATMNLPLLELNCGTWLVTGARNCECTTLESILNFVRKNHQGIIFLDEIDKSVVTRNEWSLSIQQEIYALLDVRTGGFEGWGAQDAKKFRSKIFVIGAGTWQTLYKGESQKIGFKPEDQKVSLAGSLENQTEIPEELLFRFNASLVEIEPMSRLEIGKRIQEIRRALRQPELPQDELERLSQIAVDSRKNTRWLEAYVSDLLMERFKWTGEVPKADTDKKIPGQDEGPIPTDAETF